MTEVLPHVLSDLRVLDLSRALAGPACSRMLAEMGAEVLKIEPGPNGDMSRGLSVFRNDRSLYYVQQNRGKKGLCLNLHDPRGIELVKELVPHVDVVLENFRPGVMENLGLGFERLKELKSDIILCSISAMGQTGPLKDKPGYDYIAQAYAGVTSMVGDPDDAPYIPHVGVGDIGTGVHAALAIVSALRHRDRTGAGQHLDVSLMDVYYHYHEANVQTYSGSDGTIKPTRTGRHMTYLCPCGVFRATGGSVMIMALMQHWKDLCEAMGRTDLAEHPDYKTDALRLERKDEVVKLVEDWLQTFPDVPSAVAHLEQHGVPVAPVLSVEETVTHPHHRSRGTVRTVPDPLHGDFEMPGHPLRFSEFPEPLPLVAPTLGQHNEEILGRYLGRTPEELQQLSDDGVLIKQNR